MFHFLFVLYVVFFFRTVLCSLVRFDFSFWNSLQWIRSLTLICFYLLFINPWIFNFRNLCKRFPLSIHNLRTEFSLHHTLSCISSSLLYSFFFLFSYLLLLSSSSYLFVFLDTFCILFFLVFPFAFFSTFFFSLCFSLLLTSLSYFSLCFSSLAELDIFFLSPFSFCFLSFFYSSSAYFYLSPSFIFFDIDFFVFFLCFFLLHLSI